jgi:hypothetical protein
MKIADVKDRAREINVKVGGMNKTKIIRAIQAAEGNYPCYKTAKDYCDQYDCCWREDCVPKG